MHQTWVYMSSPSWTPLPPTSPSHPSGSFQWTSPVRPVSCVKPRLAIYFTYGNIHVSMLFSQISPSPSPTESNSLFFTSVSLLLSPIQGYCYHLSVFPVVMYGCESWTVKKAERRRIDAFELWAMNKEAGQLKVFGQLKMFYLFILGWWTFFF